MVPVMISGTLSDPKFRPDLSGIVKGDQLKEEASKLLQEITKEKGQEKEGVLEQLIPGLLPSKKKK